jgi:hypothetical protein
VTHTTTAQALFVSPLQPSEQPDAEAVSAAIASSLSSHGGERGCAADLAEEYGDHPEMAADRMRWALSLAVN